VNHLDVIIEPEKHGMKICGHCNGYGSSLKDKTCQVKCSKCGGSGLLVSNKKEKKDV